MVKSCSAVGCLNRYQTGSSISFHRFPIMNKNTSTKWLKNMRRANFTPTESSFVCSDHFEKSCYWKGHKSNILKHGSIPTIFNFSVSNTGCKRLIPLPSTVIKKSKDESIKSPLVKIATKRSLRIQNRLTKNNLKLKVKRKKIDVPKSDDEILNEEIATNDFQCDSDDGMKTEMLSDSNEKFALINDKYVKGDHTYVKKIIDIRNDEESIDTKGKITDANMLEAISVMGKTNAVILLVKNKVKTTNAIIKKRDVINLEYVDVKGDDFFLKDEPFNDEFKSVADQMSGLDHETNDEDCELGEVKTGSRAGVLGKCNAEFIKILHEKDCKVFDRLLTTIDDQNTAIVALKFSLHGLKRSVNEL